jgi:DNA-binding NarL/FixJ family response regulator
MIPSTVVSPDCDELARIGKSVSTRAYVRRGVPMSNETVRVVLADDHAMMREGLRLVLRGVPDITVVGEAENGQAAVALARRATPDVVVLDLDMPASDGMIALREFGHAAPDVRVLILTVRAEHECLIPALEAGARGYLTKEATSRDLVEAIRVVAAGQIYVRPATARLLAAAVVPHRNAQTPRGRFESLSLREQAIVRLLARGYSGAEAARQLGVSSKTVDAYKHRVQEKLGLRHRTDYVRFALEAGVLVL